MRERRNRNEIIILPSVRGARWFFTTAFAKLIAPGRDFRVPSRRRVGRVAQAREDFRSPFKRETDAVRWWQFTERKDRSFLSASVRSEYSRSPRVSAGCALATFRQISRNRLTTIAKNATRTLGLLLAID